MAEANEKAKARSLSSLREARDPLGRECQETPSEDHLRRASDYGGALDTVRANRKATAMSAGRPVRLPPDERKTAYRCGSRRLLRSAAHGDGRTQRHAESFSDGGRFDPRAQSSRHGEWSREGADILDIGAESTGPTAARSPCRRRRAGAAWHRSCRGRSTLGVPVSIDTMKAERRGLGARSGAAIVNDVWGLQRDRDMAKRGRATHGVPIIIMHNREAADPALDIMADIDALFTRSLDIADARRHRAASNRARSRASASARRRSRA